VAAMNASLRGLSVTQETVRAREAGPTRRHASRWQVLKRFASVAEAEGHHPDLVLSYGSLAVRLWTHAAGGLTENDFILAAKFDRVAPA